GPGPGSRPGHRRTPDQAPTRTGGPVHPRERRHPGTTGRTLHPHRRQRGPALPLPAAPAHRSRDAGRALRAAPGRHRHRGRGGGVLPARARHRPAAGRRRPGPPRTRTGPGMSTASISHPSPQRGTLGVVQRWYGIEQVPALPGSVVTIGNFDGVHLGHQAVLAQVTATAAQLQVPAVALTFDPHPATVHRPGQAPELLTGLQDRLELLAATGIDATLVIPYTLDFAQFSAEEFVRRYLVEALRVRTVVVGQDVR